MILARLPMLNAALNAASALFVIAGFVFIRRRRIGRHRACMLLAVLTSTLFLISYLVHHARVGSTPYEGTGGLRLLYFAILISHTVLATAVVPLVGLTLLRALGGRFERHAAIARYTLPIWLYVSITGVIVYLMLYGTGDPAAGSTLPVRLSLHCGNLWGL